MMSYYSVQQSRKNNRTLIFHDEIKGPETIGIFHLQEGAKAICECVQHEFEELNNYKNAVQTLTLDLFGLHKMLRAALIFLLIFVVLTVLLMTGVL